MPDAFKTDSEKVIHLKSQGKILHFKTPVVMGILNITPDSFYDGGKYSGISEILKQVERMLIEGASIIDVGAVSTRPGSSEITEIDEWNRLRPVLSEMLLKFPDIIISVDTYRCYVAQNAIAGGAFLINDISGGTLDKQMPETIARLKVPFVMMHIKGIPQNMQINPEYTNVVFDVKEFFRRQLQLFSEYGMRDNIILDPGFGFGKTLLHNYELLRKLETFKEFGFPVMAGLSRKSLINKVLNINAKEALNGTSVLNAIALLNEADILRVHDVKEAMETIKLVSFYKNQKET
jgi:dihydropteroate synthase